MQCRGCEKWHLMSDNLHWFVDGDKFRVHEMLESGMSPELMKKQFMEMVEESKSKSGGDGEEGEGLGAEEQGHTIYDLELP